MINTTRTIHFNEEIRRKMPITFVKRSTLPPSVKGKAAGGPTLSITENGQIQLSKASADFLGGAKTVVIGFEGLKCYVIMPTAKMVKDVKIEDHCQVSYPKSGSGATISAAAILRGMKEFGASVVYDFKASRNQTFTASLEKDKAGNAVAIVAELPASGSLEPKPVVHREKKTATAAAPQVAKAASAGEVELSLE